MADDAEGIDTTTDVGAPLLSATLETPQRPEPPVPPVPPREPRPRSILGRLTVAASLIGIGVLALLHTADIVEPDPVHYFALVLAVVGAGLLVGALFGRARWLIAVGILLLPIVWIASVGPTWTINNEVGEYHYQIESLADLDAYAAVTGNGSGYEIAVGSLQLDLTGLDLDEAAPAGPIPIAASVGVGEVIIRLPAGTTATGEASVGIGSVTVFGDQSAGLGVSRDFEVDGDAMFSVDASAGIGSVVVTTERAPISIRRSTGWEG